jgi:hypothetical protein
MEQASCLQEANNSQDIEIKDTILLFKVGQTTTLCQQVIQEIRIQTNHPFHPNQIHDSR